MKQFIIIIASLIFGLLFYDNHIGLNLLIFSIITCILLALNNFNRFKNKIALIHTFIYLVTAALVFIHQSSLAIIANCAAFFTLIGIVSEHHTSIYVTWLNGTYTSIAGFFHRTFEVKSK